MDIRDYIESGVIESYVLGLADAEEVADLELRKQQHPEIQKAIDDFSASLEEYAFANAVIPPADVKARLMAILASESEASNPNPLTVAYSHNANKLAEVPLLKMKTWSFAAAASIILLVVSAAANIYLYNKYSRTKSQYQALLTEKTALQASNEIYEAKNREYRSAAEMIADPTVVMVKMRDPAKKQSNMTTVFWNSVTKDVYLMTNKLPSVPSKDKQYQLWALVDGKPVDAGMIDLDCTSLCRMKNIPRAQAFAITLEKAGGSPVPDMKQLFVLGNV